MNDRFERRNESLIRAGLSLLDDSSSLRLSPLDAWKLVVGASVVPDAVVADDSEAFMSKVDEEWRRVATRERLLAAGSPFWIHVAGHGALRQGWRKVALTDRTEMARNLGNHPGEPEFIAMDLAERVVCAVTTEEDDAWIIAVRLDGE